ncbi:hypothetical protein HMPREF0591_2331 [Mycobacterium parascrofulaceum ATCC BAA-614]|uniref:VOC domain-containing protein n=1 Tax=Mycobacterium parascrofulaceum ATCC BAA-614 TaxID=525368 RepID=D5P837_9MYCO|nr:MULTISPECIES: VOC family protein [Mycobacterium]EFG77793.1 hypothetical protein HMPREF0591_2331 [Mycobacterium parascrofulaceum ATCC BAA-614]OCB60625.1 hypothetical protein A9X02_06470 [Mycobacterium malmoense]
MGLTVERIDHVVLNCNDVEATAAWHERVLGMRRETFGPTGRVALRFGQQKPNLRPVGALGPMTSHYCRDVDGNLVEIPVYERL